MARKIEGPTIVEVAGNKPQIIEAYNGDLNTRSPKLSAARSSISPNGWIEPERTPGLDDYSLVMKGQLQARAKTEALKVEANQAVFTPARNWVKNSTPNKMSAEYNAICIPGFTSDTVNRDEEGPQ